MKKDLRPIAWDAKVAKSNELIQKSRYSLSVQEQKIMLYLISQITPYDDDFKEYEFSIVEFCKACGIEYNGKNYKDLKDAILQIKSKPIGWAVSPRDGRTTIMEWIKKPHIDEHTGTIGIELDEDLKPYLLQLKENYTEYELIWTLHFKSKYSVRLYELIKSIHYHELSEYTREYTLEELKRMLDAETYTTFQTFKSRVLNTAVNEINNYSDKNVTWEPIYKGKAVAKIKFTITTKSSLDVMMIREDIEKEFGYDPNQLDMWSMNEDKT